MNTYYYAEIVPFPCAVIIHIRFIGYNLSRAIVLSTPNSIANVTIIFCLVICL